MKLRTGLKLSMKYRTAGTISTRAIVTTLGRSVIWLRKFAMFGQQYYPDPGAGDIAVAGRAFPSGHALRDHASHPADQAPPQHSQRIPLAQTHSNQLVGTRGHHDPTCPAKLQQGWPTARHATPFPDQLVAPGHHVFIAQVEHVPVQRQREESTARTPGGKPEIAVSGQAKESSALRGQRFTQELSPHSSPRREQLDPTQGRQQCRFTHVAFAGGRETQNP